MSLKNWITMKLRNLASVFFAFFLFGIHSSIFAQEDPSDLQLQLNEKEDLLNNAIEEIVYLKKEKEAFEKKSDKLSKKYAQLLVCMNFLREGRQFEATVELEKINKIDAEDTHVLESLGLLYSELKLYDKATASFEKLLSLKPRDERIYSNLGFISAQQGYHQRAIDQYLKALSLNPEFAVAHYNLGLSFTELGKRGKAVEHFRTAAQLFSSDSPWKRLAEQKVVRYSAIRGQQ